MPRLAVAAVLLAGGLTAVVCYPRKPRPPRPAEPPLSEVVIEAPEYQPGSGKPSPYPPWRAGPADSPKSE